MLKKIIFIIILLSSSCASVTPLNSSSNQHYYQLDDFELIGKECNNCEEQLRYAFNDTLATMLENQKEDKRYIVEVRATSRKERSSIRIDGTAMRSKALIKLEYQIIERTTKKIVYKNSLFQIDSVSTAISPFDDFSGSETLSIQLMIQALNELKARLVLFAMAKAG